MRLLGITMLLSEGDVRRMERKGDYGGLKRSLRTCKQAPDNIRDCAVKALIRSRSQDAFDVLAEALRGNNIYLKRSIIGTMEDEIPGELVELLASTLQEQAFRSCVSVLFGGIMDVGAVDPLILALNNESISQPTRAIVIDLLGKLGESRAAEPILSSFRDPGLGLKVLSSAFWSLRSLGWDPTEDDVRSLCSLVRPSPSNYTSEEEYDHNRTVGLAIEALGHIATERALTTVFRTLTSTKRRFGHDAWKFDDRVRESARKILDNISNPHLLKVLVQAFRSEKPFECKFASECLLKLFAKHVSEEIKTACDSLSLNSHAWQVVAASDWDKAKTLGADALEPLNAVIFSSRHSSSEHEHAKTIRNELIEILALSSSDYERSVGLNYLSYVDVKTVAHIMGRILQSAEDVVRMGGLKKIAGFIKSFFRQHHRIIVINEMVEPRQRMASLLVDALSDSSERVREEARLVVSELCPMLVTEGMTKQTSQGGFALSLLTIFDYHDKTLIEYLLKELPSHRKSFETEDTSHGGTTYWQLYGDWVIAGEQYLKALDSSSKS